MSTPDAPQLRLGPFAAAVDAGSMLALRDDGPSFAVHGDVLGTASLARELGLSQQAPLVEVLASAWSRWSTNALRRLDGVFAIAVRSGRRLWLYNDPGGLSHIYWQRGAQGELLYATRLEKLFALPGARRVLARRSLHEYLRLLDVAVPNTLFDGVQALEPGQWLEFDGTQLTASGDAALPAGESFGGSFDEALESLSERLRATVRLALHGAERPAAFLSGGIDSALLCSLAAQERPDLVTLTVGFDGAPFDESQRAARIASHLGLRHQVLRFGRDEYLGALRRLATTMDHPTADPATPATVLAFEHCRARHDVVLDGTGADEAVGAIPPRHARLAVEWADRLPAAIRHALARALRRVPGVSRYAPILDFVHPADLLTRWRGFTEAQIAELCGGPVSLGHTRLRHTFERFERHAHFERFSAMVDAMPCERLTQAMAVTGASVRFPFLAREVDGFLRQLRTEFRHGPGQPKRILRELLARHVPRPLWDLPKHGFDFPLTEFLRGDDHHLVRHHLDADRWRTSGLLRGDVVARYGREFIAGDHGHSFRVWSLVLLDAWLTQHALQD